MNANVLLVDDDPKQLKLTRLRLEAAGYSVSSANNAAEALEQARLRVPDVIVSDVLMNSMDGFTLCRTVRETPALAHIPVVLLSAYVDDVDNVELARRVGASRMVVRTPNQDAELAAIAACLDSTPQPMSKSNSHDISARVRVAALTKLSSKAKQADARFRALFENAPDTVTVLSPDGWVIDANNRWLDVLGRSADDCIGTHIRDFAAPGHADTNHQAFLDSIDNGRATRPVPMQHANGRTVFMEFVTARVTLDERSVVLAIGRDVTERLIAMESLSSAEEKYRSLVERIPDVVWTMNDQGEITFVTPNVAQITGFSMAELSLLSFAQLVERIHPDDRAKAETLLADGGRERDCRWKHKNGRWVWLRVRLIARYAHDGRCYFDGMASDISEKMILEESMRQAQKMEAVGALTGGIAHDFNNMLAVILADSQFLLDELSEQDPRRADAQNIKLVAERAAALTRQLLAFSRKQVLEPKVVDLNVAVSNLERMLHRLIGEDITLAVQAAPDLGSVRIDVAQLEQVLMNLVVNARDAMPTGGKITIQTSNVRVEDASKGRMPAGNYVQLSVSDNGTGMDEATRQRVFEPFFTTKPLGRGTGLGLSTCYGIVKQSDGFIWVESELGRGTTFSIYLPCHHAAADTATHQPVSAPAGGNQAVLLVEDDDRVRAALERVLRNNGYRVRAAAGASEALRLAAEGPVDLVLSDVVMPGQSGPALVRELKDRCPTVKVLFMSGFTDHATLHDLQGHFIQKPFTPDVLAKRVREALA